MSSAGQRSCKELCKELPNSQPSHPGQAGGPAELILIPVAASHGNVFCCSHCGYKKCLFHVFKSRHVVALRCLLGFCFCFFSLFWFSASKMLRSLQTDTHTHSQVRLILFIYSALPGESACISTAWQVLCLHTKRGVYR